MKVLGTAHGVDPGLIIEFTRHEVDLLEQCQKALEGGIGWEIFQNMDRSGRSIKPELIFTALYGWLKCRLAVNELKVALELVGKATGEYAKPEIT